MDINQSRSSSSRQAPPSSTEPEPVPGAGSCCCTSGNRSSVPASASRGVKRTRIASISIIVINSIMFIWNGLLSSSMWNVETVNLAIAVFGGSIVLLSFSKTSYTLAAVLYAAGFPFGVVHLVCWFFFALEWYQEREQASYDYTDDVPIALSAVLIVPIAIQTVAFLVGSVFASKAIYNWHKSGFYSNTGEDGPQHPLLV